MSVRYTGETTMDEPALRDVERWKDKIEVRLDNRQVFFLFFGSAMVACMLFVLGVIVGKRLETRGRAEAPAMEDPLAVLDRFGVAAASPAPQPTTALAFPRALGGNASSAPGGTSSIIEGGLVKKRGGSALPSLPERADKPAVRAERLTGKPTMTATLSGAPVAPIAAPKLAPALAPLPKPAVPASRAAALSSTPPSTTLTPPPAAPAVKRLAALPRPLSLPADKDKEKDKARQTVSLAKDPVAPTAKVGGAVGTAKVAPPSGVDKAKGRFLLQLSSFQDRGEAEAFARRFGTQNAYVVASEIPGKGIWYRVRVGSYASMQDATLAKATFEREHNVIAYVAGGGAAK